MDSNELFRINDGLQVRDFLKLHVNFTYEVPKMVFRSFANFVTIVFKREKSFDQDGFLAHYDYCKQY